VFQSHTVFVGREQALKVSKHRVQLLWSGIAAFALTYIVIRASGVPTWEVYLRLLEGAAGLQAAKIVWFTVVLQKVWGNICIIVS